MANLNVPSRVDTSNCASRGGKSTSGEAQKIDEFSPQQPSGG
jgi:hypothetical protein